MGNAVLKAFVRVFLPLILLILSVVLVIAFIKILSHRESERNSDDYLARELITTEINTEPIEKSF